LIIIAAEAVELGYPDYALLQQLLQKLPCEQTKGFAASVAKGVLASRRGKSSACLFFRRALVEKSSISAEHVAFARSCLSNCWRRLGNLEEARREIARARNLVAASNLPEIDADLAVSEAWLQFRLDSPTQAYALCDWAELLLHKVMDHRRLADISSLRGRIEQRGGRLSKAASHYEASLRYYNETPIAHRGNGRALINFAKLKWLQARKLGVQIDQATQRLGRTTLASHDVQAISLNRISDFFRDRRREMISWEELQHLVDLDRRHYGRSRAQGDQLVKQRTGILRDAHSLLDSARDFYANHAAWLSFRGLASVSIVRAHLLIEEREWTAAIRLANLTFELGQQLGDRTVRARAKILEAMARVQQLWDSAERSLDEVALVRHQAKQAVDLSSLLDDKRIRVKAHTWYGFSQLLQSPPNTSDALISIKIIEQMLVAMPDDYVTEDADMLKRMCEQIATQDNNYVTSLAELVSAAATWGDIKERVLDIMIEHLLRQSDYRIIAVQRQLKIHPRRVRRVRDRLLNIRRQAEPRTRDYESEVREGH